jgi:bacteriocin resistance YdeI/OmpD-like protein/uncharacterized protein DUF1905
MKFSFASKIYKVGINLFVEVPEQITTRMTPLKGYIPVRGKIKEHAFEQTLVPVKNAPYRLYVNGPMLKGSETKLGDLAKFVIEQNPKPTIFPMPAELKSKLKSKGLLPAFQKLTPGRRKEILRYLNFLKTPDALLRNIDKVIAQLANNK